MDWTVSPVVNNARQVHETAHVFDRSAYRGHMAGDIESIIRRIMREELNRARPESEPELDGKRAYSVQSMSDAYEVSVSYLRDDIATGKLRPKYLGRKPLISVAEAERWFAALPDDRPTT